MKIHIKHLISGFLCIALLVSNLAIPVNAAAYQISNSKQSKITFNPMDTPATPLATPSGSWNGTTATWNAVPDATGYTVTLLNTAANNNVASTIIQTSLYGGSTTTCDFSSNISVAGNYTYTVTATGVANPTTITSNTYVYYKNLSLALDSGSGGLTKSHTQTITGIIGTSNNPDNGLASDTVTLYDGTPSGNPIGSGTISGAKFSISCSLSDGTHNIVAVVSNGSSTSATSNALSVTVDTVAPTGYSIDNSLSTITSADNAKNYSFIIDKAEAGCTYNYKITDTGTDTNTNSITGSGTVGGSDGSIVAQTTVTVDVSRRKEGKLTLSVTLTDKAGNVGTTATATFIKNTGTAPAITTASLPDGFMNTAYSQTLAATNLPVTSWKITSGNLPDGLSLDVNTGIISGTPVKSGQFQFGITATNAAGDGPEKTFTINIYVVPSITTTTLPDGTINTSYSQTLQAQNTPTSWSITSGNLPYGLTLNPISGVISGTPTIAGTYTFYATATNLAGSSSQLLTIKINAVPIISAMNLAIGNANTPYSQTLSAVNSPTSWKVSSGTLPTGLSLDSTKGIISGTPTAVGIYTFYVTAANSLGTSNAQQFTIIITGTPSITTGSLQDGKVGTSYTQTLAATNTPTSWSIISGSLPAGLLFNTTTGSISGTPTTVGIYTFSILATNAKGSSDIKQFTITIYGVPNITTTSLPNGKVNVYYYQNLSAINSPTSWSIVSGTLPAGLVMSASNGTICGYPTTAGVCTFSVTAVNPAGISIAQQLTIVVTAGTATPVDVTINGSGSSTVSTAKIMPSNINSATTKNVTVILNSASITAAASLFNSIIGGNDSNWLELSQSATDANTQTAITTATALAHKMSIATFDINLTKHYSGTNSEVVHQLNGYAIVTVNLTAAQIAQLKRRTNLCLLYYNPDTKALANIKAVFNLKKKAVTFSTNHLSTFVIAVKSINSGVKYKSLVQHHGWQKYKSNGAVSGTTGKRLALQGLNISLTGDLPTGASITYQIYAHGKGWLKEVSDGKSSGIASKYIEGLRITISGLKGYRIRYCAHIKNTGWQNWKATSNGTAITAAVSAGKIGKNLSIESVRIILEKIPS